MIPPRGWQASEPYKYRFLIDIMHLMLQGLFIRLTRSGFTCRLTCMTFSAERPQVALRVIASELKRDTVVEFTVSQINNPITHTAVTTVTRIDTALQTHPCTSTYAALLTVDRLDASRINGFQAWL
ncbi:hypothetical protein ASV06_02990 [Enterobacter hormaechei subsp. xiangfangensis]|nr:hypothetical protein ASV06_02990 [Enterobacter hormaechei subsp. xiangfangensis]